MTKFASIPSRLKGRVRPRTSSAAAALVLTLVCASASADQQVPPERTAVLVLRILAFDRNLTNRSPQSAAIAVVTDSPHNMPTHCREFANQVDTRAQHMTVLGLPTRAMPVTPGQLEGIIEYVTAAYICHDAMHSLPRVLALTRKAQILTISDASESVEHGVSITIVARGNRPKILLNLDHAREEGADFDSALLRVAEIQQ